MEIFRFSPKITLVETQPYVLYFAQRHSAGALLSIGPAQQGRSQQGDQQAEKPPEFLFVRLVPKPQGSGCVGHLAVVSPTQSVLVP